MKENKLKTGRKHAVVTGLFFISASASAIAGVLLYGPILGPDYLVKGAQNSANVIWGAIFELILAVSNIGTGIMLYPKLRRYSESWGLGYVCFRMLEVVFIMVGILAVLGILTLSHQYISTPNPDKSMFETVGRILKEIHMYTFILGPKYMLGVNTFIYSLIFFRSKLVIRPLALLGIFGAVLIFITAVVEMFGIVVPLSTTEVILAMPIAIYEMILAGWLITKGFNEDTSHNVSSSIPIQYGKRKESALQSV